MNLHELSQGGLAPLDHAQRSRWMLALSGHVKQEHGVLANAQIGFAEAASAPFDKKLT